MTGGAGDSKAAVPVSDLARDDERHPGPGLR
jgi:hypothetical protein